MEIKIEQVVPFPIKDFGFNKSDIWKNNFIFSSGEIYQIIALSGIGKSTLINILYGDRKDYNSNIHFDNKNIKQFDLKDWTNIRRTKIGKFMNLADSSIWVVILIGFVIIFSIAIINRFILKQSIRKIVLK